MSSLRLTRLNPLPLLLCLLFSWPLLRAQVNAVSPLTVFGVGDLSEGYFAQNFGIGGSSIAVREPAYINIANPASYSAIELTTLEVAVSQRFIQQRIESTNQEMLNSSTYFNYFGLGLKLNEWWGASVSLSPYSFVGYNVFTVDSVPEFGDVLYQFQGKGGINQVVIGNAFEPFKNLSVGINVRYLFGSWDRSDAVLFNNGSFYNAKRLTASGVKSFAFDYGLQYTQPLGNDFHLTVGANYATQANLNATQSSVKYTFIYNTQGIEVPVDTISYALDDQGNITLPSRYGAGISLGKKNIDYFSYAWMLTGEYSTTAWSGYRGFGGEGGLNDSWRATIGGYFIPAYAFPGSKRAKSYLSRIEYRFGAFYEETQVTLGNLPVLNKAITLGFGLPIAYRSLAPGEKKNTIINLGIVVGQKGNGQPNQLQERYVNLMLGLTLGDQWFQKFKYR